MEATREAGRSSFMPRKPLDALEGFTLASAGRWVFNTCPDASRRVRGLGRSPSGLARMLHTHRVRTTG